MKRLLRIFIRSFFFLSLVLVISNKCENIKIYDNSIQNLNSNKCNKDFFSAEEFVPVPEFIGSKNDLKNTLTIFGSSVSKEGLAYLYWGVCPEKENAGFEIQKFYKNRWEYVSGVSSYGDSKKMTYYDLPVEHYNGLNKYRIKQIDKDGRFSYSEPLEVDWAGERMNLGNHPVFSDPGNILVILDDNEGNTVALKTQIKYENGTLVATRKPHQVTSGNYKIMGSSTNIFDGSTLVIR